MSLAIIGPPEILLILVVILVLFGGSQLPKLARSLGQAQKELKKGMTESASDDAGSDSKDGDGPTNDSKA
jgi:sec-independent protein translocase protein TatA